MFLILFKIFSSLPYWIVQSAAHLIAFMTRLFSLRILKTSRDNLIHCFNTEGLLKKSIYETTLSSLEFPYVWGRPDNIKKLIEGNQNAFIGLDRKPMLIFTLHMGCVDVMLFYLALNLKSLNILYTPAKNISLNTAVKSARESTGAKMFSILPKEFNKMFKSFKNGNHIAIASDLVPHKKGKYSTFFNKECLCLDLIEKLSKKNTHQLVFVYFTLGKTKRYKFNYKTLDRPINVDDMNSLFETAIKECPELYGWEYKKFRKLSGQKKNIY